LASDNGRYITVTPERAILSVGDGWPLHMAVINKVLAVSLPERLLSGRFASKTAVRFQNGNGQLELEAF
jgi:hypothetical protein